LSVLAYGRSGGGGWRWGVGGGGGCMYRKQQSVHHSYVRDVETGGNPSRTGVWTSLYQSLMFSSTFSCN